MKRTYANTEVEQVATFFYGTEVEHSPAYNMSTMFVVGVQPGQTISNMAKLGYEVKHIYLGANQSFAPVTSGEWEQWDAMIKPLLAAGYWVTLDIDVQYAESILEESWCEHRRFIPMISVKLPYVAQFNYNTTIKIDDTGFEASNPGVWCHRLHNLLDDTKFTSWDKYNDDKIAS